MIKFDAFFVLFHCIILNPMLAIAVRSTVPFFPAFTPIAAMQFDSFIELIYILIECLVLVRCHKRQKITHKLTASYTWRTNKNVLSCHHKETVTAYRNGEKIHRFESMKKREKRFTIINPFLQRCLRNIALHIRCRWRCRCVAYDE